jgi:hypothetical protein
MLFNLALDPYDDSFEAVVSQGFFAPNGAQNDISVEANFTSSDVILSEVKDPYDDSFEAVESP